MNVLKYTEIIIRQVLKSWPPQSAGNSPKEILMVQEITTILETMMSAVEENNEVEKSIICLYLYLIRDGGWGERKVNVVLIPY